MELEKDNIKFKSVYRINRSTEECTDIHDLTNINDFVINVIFDQIKINTNKRKFESSNESTQIYSFCCNLILKYSSEYLENNEFKTKLYNNAVRLLNAEIDAQDRINKLGNVEVTKGSLITALIQKDTYSYIVFVKIEHDEFIEDTAYEYKGGIPTKNKKYKSCIYIFCENELENIMLYDQNNSEYWYKGFLELKKVGDDSKFTERAIKIFKESINYFNDDSPQDCVGLIQLVNTYFSTNTTFVYSDIIEQINNYPCFYEGFSTSRVIEKINEKKEKVRNHFENLFEIDRNKIKKLKQRYKVNKKVEIELMPDGNLNEDNTFADNDSCIENFIISSKVDDKAFLKIYTDDISILNKFNYEKVDFSNIISINTTAHAEAAME